MLWNEFNIKTFPAETIVFRDGIFQPELSTLSSVASRQSPVVRIGQFYELPIHVIYVGEIENQNNLEIDISDDSRHTTGDSVDRRLFLTIKILNKKPAFFNIFIKNAGENSLVHSTILVQNYADLEIDVTATHLAENTGIFIKTKIVAHHESKTKVTGAANINPDCKNCESEISLAALADPSAIIEFKPWQLIAAAPKSAEHSAAIYHGTAPQIEYLRTAGLGTTEIKKALEEAFLND